jgi:hypothetical protein
MDPRMATLEYVISGIRHNADVCPTACADPTRCPYVPHPDLPRHCPTCTCV